MRAPLPPCCYDDMLALIFIIIIVIIINISSYYKWLTINSSYYYYYYYYYYLVIFVVVVFSSSAIVHVSILFSAWQSTPLACSPRSSSIAFSTILESQLRTRNTNLNRYVSLYCHNLHSTKSYKPMWVLDGFPIVALMQLLTYLFDMFRFYAITTTLTVSNAILRSHKPRELWRARGKKYKPCYIFRLFYVASIRLFLSFSSLSFLVFFFLQS